MSFPLLCFQDLCLNAEPNVRIPINPSLIALPKLRCIELLNVKILSPFRAGARFA